MFTRTLTAICVAATLAIPVSAAEAGVLLDTVKQGVKGNAFILKESVKFGARAVKTSVKFNAVVAKCIITKQPC